jgi:hypothetical protein
MSSDVVRGDLRYLTYIYIYVKFLALLGAPYIYDIRRLSRLKTIFLFGGLGVDDKQKPSRNPDLTPCHYVHWFWTTRKYTDQSQQHWVSCDNNFELYSAFGKSLRT